MNNEKVFVAGASGLVGGALVRQLSLLDCEIVMPLRQELDLRDFSQLKSFLRANQPDVIYLAAARVGGIHANLTYPAEFILDNLTIQSNVIHAAFDCGVNRLLFLGSSCVYPRHSRQPIKEDELLCGPLEPTNEPYAIAKIAGIKMCESYNRQYGTDYRCVMPTNLYGPGENYHPQNSHVIPALLARFHEAKIKQKPFVSVWGSGRPLREFMYIDDMARACIHIMGLTREVYAEHTSPMLSHINVGTGTDISIANLAYLISNVVGYEGQITFDSSKPDGMPRKLLDVSKLTRLGWSAITPLEEGLRRTYSAFVSTIGKQ